MFNTQQYNDIAQRPPLFTRKFIRVDQANADCARESAFLVPLIDLMYVMSAPVRRGCAMNDDAVDVLCVHAAMMAASEGLSMAEGVPGERFLE